MKKISFMLLIVLLGISLKFSGKETEHSDNNSSHSVAYYSITGDKLSGPQPGLMIVKTSDGNVRKVVMK